jgi:hypothetical protein
MWKTRYFSVAEFEFGKGLSREHRDLALKHATLLDPVRQFCRGRLIITSFLRGTSGSHSNGLAVDIQPRKGADPYIRRIADFMAALYRPGKRGSALHQIIYEAPELGQKRAHIHIVLAGYIGGATSGYLLDLEGNQKYIVTALPHITMET